MRIKRLSSALVVSVVCHIVVVIIAGFYWVTQTQQFKDLIGVEVFQAKEPPKPKVRKPVVKPVIKPTVPMRNSVTIVQNRARPCCVDITRGTVMWCLLNHIHRR